MRVWVVTWATWLFAQGGGVRFFQGSWQALLSEAQKQKRLIFVDFYTVWCGPCKMLERYTFSNPEVGDYVEKNYLAYRVDAEKGDGVRLADQYRIRAYPTIVFLDPQGNEIGRHVGYADAPTFLNILRRYLERYTGTQSAPQPTWDSFKEQYKVFFADLTLQTWDTSFRAKLARLDAESGEAKTGESVADEVLGALSAWRRGQKEVALHTLHHKLYQQRKLTPMQSLWLAGYALLNWEDLPPETIQWATFSTKNDPTGIGYLTQAALYYRLGRTTEAQKSLREARIGLPINTPAVKILSALLDQK